MLRMARAKGASAIQIESAIATPGGRRGFGATPAQIALRAEWRGAARIVTVQIEADLKVTGRAIDDRVRRRAARGEIHAVTGTTPGRSWHSACAGPEQLGLRN
jgi:hypothetical protein